MVINAKLIPLIFAIAMIVPIGVVSAQENTNDANDTFNPPDFDEFTDDSVKGPVGIVDDLNAAHNLVTNLMVGDPTVITNEDLVLDDIYLQAVYVDEENEKLVIWLDPYHIFDPIDVEDLKDDLFIDVPVEIKYGFFMPETHTSLAPTMPSSSPLHCPVSHSTKCYIWDKYVQNCTSGNTANYCSSYKTLLIQWGLTPPSSTTTPPPTTTPTPSLPDGVVFQDGFSNGLGQWTESGQREWQTGTLDENRVISGYTRSNIVAEADDCDDRACILTMSDAVNLSPYSSATLEFDRFVDNSLDRNEYLKVEVGNNGNYNQVFYWTHGSGDDDRWHHETLDLSSYLSSGFKVRISTEQSSSSEDVAIDNVVINVESVSACTINVNSQLLSSGAIRTTWNDCGDDYDRYEVYVSKNGASDRLFRATSGNSYTLSNTDEGASYTFKVKARVASDRSSYTDLFSGPTVTVPIVDRTAPVIMATRGISTSASSVNGAHVTFSATAHDAVDGIVSVSCSPPSRSLFPVGTTNVTCTATDAAGNTATKNVRIYVGPYIAPDADNDGFADDVDQCPNQASSTNNGCPVVPPVVPPTNGTITNGTNTIPVNGTSIIPTNGTDNKLVIYAGDRHVVRFTVVDGSGDTYTVGPHNGTIAFTGVNVNGEQGFIAAGHTFDESEGSRYTPITVQSYSQEYHGIQVSDQDVVSPTSSELDAAWLAIDTTVAKVSNQILRHDGQMWNYTQGIRSDVEINTPIEMSGNMTNSEGMIQYTNATIRYYNSHGQGATFINYFIGNQTSTGGDSGAPITTGSGENRKIIGMHSGHICQYPSPLVTETDPIDVRSTLGQNNHKICDYTYDNWLSNPINHPTNTYQQRHTVIIPWDLIANEFNLR